MEVTKTQVANEMNQAQAASNSSFREYGKTVGEPELSKEAKKYYQELKKKFGNLDFILVSSEEKANAQANAAKYANAAKTVVLIDEEKIEKMAKNEKYREKYEGIIRDSITGLSSMKSQLERSGADVAGYGMQINDDSTTSFFAVLKESSAQQKARIEKKAQENKEAKKAQRKEDAKKLEETRKQKKEEPKESQEEDAVIITANSLEELLQKINDYVLARQSDFVQTDVEKNVGQHIDFRG